jgi:hypothetical protein
MRTNFEINIRRKGQRLADLKNRTVELERKLSDARLSLDRELAQFAYARGPAPGRMREKVDPVPGQWAPEHEFDNIAELYAALDQPTDQGGGDAAAPATPEQRTETLVSQGRRNAYHPGLSGRSKAVIGVAAVAVAIAVAVRMLIGGGASWPASVARVQSEAAQACQNPDVTSEPGQVNFACAKDTRQILWVFALLTSGNNPDFADAKTGRLGLEPITPATGGEVAWSLNLHHPYDPTNPIDSLEVAARAINNIVGGATLTGARGNPVIEPGLESSSANCVRYTGSAALTSRSGFPAVCTKPVSSPAGQAALVADVYQKWVIGATPRTAEDAAILFANTQNPGNPQVQAILKHLAISNS